MAIYRNRLPQLAGDFFMTDGGIETTLIFHEGLELPEFAAFHLFQSPRGEDALRKYFSSYAELAHELQTGLILESPTWRASPDWLAKLGYAANALAEVNTRSIQLLEQVRAQYESRHTPIVISGCLGPRGDGYLPGNTMSRDEAELYHHAQITVLADTPADLVTALTLNYVEEAIGIVRAAQHAAMPVVISFTVETDGHLPTGQSLGDAITQVDAETQGYPAYYMINCAHPSHFNTVVQGGAAWHARIRGLRANASRMSHTQLNESAKLDDGNPAELGQQYAALKSGHLSQLNVMGGCCGTDERHIRQIATTCLPLFHTTH